MTHLYVIPQILALIFTVVDAATMEYKK